MAQKGRPDSDVTVLNWNPVPSSPTTRWDKVDEVTADDNDYIENTGNTAYDLELGLSDVTDPQTASGHIIRVRNQKTAGGGSGTAYLYEGGTQRASFSLTAGTGWATDLYNLTAEEANAISVYTDLRIRVNGKKLRVSWEEFEVPDVVINYTLTCDAGNYTASGMDTGFKTNRRIIALVSSYSGIGADAGLQYKRRLPIDASSFTWIGADANFIIGKTLSANVGDYTITGADATLKKNSELTAEIGSYIETGYDASLNYDQYEKIILADAGIFTETGLPANLKKTHIIVPEVTDFNITGNPIICQHNKQLMAGIGGYIGTGQDVSFIYAGSSGGSMPVPIAVYHYLKQEM